MEEDFFEESLNLSSRSLNSTRDNLHDTTDSLDWYETSICSYYKSNLKIAYLVNINSLQNKLDEVEKMLNRNLFHILFIAETKIEGTFSNELLKHPGYGVI